MGIIMQNENAAPEARMFETARNDEYRMVNPCWIGRKVIVHHMTREASERLFNDHETNHVKSFFGNQKGQSVDMNNYEAVAEIEYKWVTAGDEPTPFFLTQNAFDSWSQDRDGVEESTHTMRVLKPLVDGWGHRSTSVGDVIQVVDTDQWFVVDMCDYTRLFAPLSEWLNVVA